MTATTPTAAVQIPAAGIYQLDPAASTVTFATRHIFGLAPVKGTFRLVSGQITIADPVTSSTVSAVIDAASFATGNPQRDKDVKSARFLHVRDHPQITFRSTELVRDGDAWRLRGQVTARGTTAPAELTITEATASEDVLLIRATTRIDRYAHGLTRAKGIAGRHLAMEITAAQPAAERRQPRDRAIAGRERPRGPAQHRPGGGRSPSARPVAHEEPHQIASAMHTQENSRVGSRYQPLHANFSPCTHRTFLLARLR